MGCRTALPHRSPRRSPSCGRSTSSSGPAPRRPSTGRARCRSWAPTGRRAPTRARRSDGCSRTARTSPARSRRWRRCSMSEPLDVLVAFGRRLRDEGVAVGTSELLDFCRAADIARPEDFYWAGRASVVSRRADLPIYDRVFADFFGTLAGDHRHDAPELPVEEPGACASRVRTSLTRRTPEDAAVASAMELLRARSFSGCTPEELDQLAKLLGQRRMRL